MPQFQIVQCTNHVCRFRFPVVLDSAAGLCPRCGAATQIVEPSYANEKQKVVDPTLPKTEVEGLLDNIRSTYNVGSMFRTADGAGLRLLHLCGMTPTPANLKIVKTALGAEGTVAWNYHRNGLEIATTLKESGMRLWALESCSRSEPLFYSGYDLPGPPILLVVGNELSGVDPGIMDICEKIVAIPMQGRKQSLNVAIAFGIAAYYLRFGQTDPDYNKLMTRKSEKIYDPN